MTIEEKHEFWDIHFKQTFMETFPKSHNRKPSKIFLIFDTFVEFEYYDEEIWDKILEWMKNKKAWIRTKIIERLYPLTGTFPKAK